MHHFEGSLKHNSSLGRHALNPVITIIVYHIFGACSAHHRHDFTRETLKIAYIVNVCVVWQWA